MSTEILEVVPYSGEDADMRKTPRVRMVLDMSRDEADRYIRCRQDRGSLGMYAADCRPLVHAVADELAAAKKRARGS